MSDALQPPVRLSNDRVTVTVDAEAGGRLAQLSVDGVQLLVGYDEVPERLRGPDGEPTATSWGSYPMVPWAGRIRRGRFTFRGEQHALPINFGDHAIHGVGFASRWSVGAAAADAVQLELELPADRRWPFGGHVTQHIALDDRGVLVRMEVAAGDHAFPVSFGWHPWFRKPERLDFRPIAMYRRDAEGIAVDDLVEVPPGPWDDCFRNVEPVDLSIAGVALRLTSDCTEWVVFDELPHATCVEPQTGPPDAFNIAPDVVEPGTTRAAWLRIDVLG